LNDEDKSLKFEIDKTLIDKSLNKKKPKKSGISGQTVILKPAPGKVPPAARLGLDTGKMPERKSRRQMAEEEKKRAGIKPKVDLPKVVSPFRRLLAVIFDLVFFLGFIFLFSSYFQNHFIEASFIVNELSPELLWEYADVVYFGLMIIPAYVLTSILPQFLSGASIGKWLVGLKIYDQSMAKAGFMQLMMRELLRPICVATIIGPLIGFWRPYRMLHDRITGTTIKKL